MDNKNLIDVLDYRIQSIIEINDLIEKSLERDKKEIRKKFYLEVAYFIHVIKNNYELNFLFDELLSYNKKLLHTKGYLKAINEIKKSIKIISTKILKHEKYKDFEKKFGIGWVNPFDDNSSQIISLNELLMRLKNIEKNKLKINFESLYQIFVNPDMINGIVNRLYNFYEIGVEEIFNELNLYGENLKYCYYYEQFQYDFLGVNSAIQLDNIYKGLNPLFNATNINELTYNKYIQSGEEVYFQNKLIDYCKSIKEYLKQKLDSKLSVEVSINRFKHYMELFYNIETSKFSENIFQKEFELFMFNNGYFALSQGQVGNGRYDNIILNENNAFLCEHKQIGFGKTKDSKKSFLEKFQSSKIQTNIYHKRLRFFPELSKDIYILIVSRYYLKFKDNISDVTKDGLNFKFRLICLEKIVPTKIKEIEEIDIEKIIK